VTNPSVLEPNKVLSSHQDIHSGRRSSVAMRIGSHGSGNREGNSKISKRLGKPSHRVVDW